MAQLNLYFTQVDAIGDSTRAFLSEHKFKVDHLRMREVIFLPNSVPQECDAWILSSKQAAKWLTQHRPHFLKPIYCVGQTTSDILRSAGIRPEWSDPPANAQALVDRLSHLEPQRFVFLRSPQSKEIIPSGLEAINHKVHSLIVYMTETIYIPIELAVNHLVYFQSPSSVYDYIRLEGSQPNWTAAIGPSTRRALEAVGWQADFVPSRPETEHFIKELVLWWPHRKRVKQSH